tara:strand:+ start:22401 stop:23927 length:1527 start_codon:yes stop_codon:yes gene_type:complete
MAELNLEKVANNMGGLVRIQKEMLTILRASSTAMKAQSKAMETLGESAKKTTEEVKEVETILTRFIGGTDKGFLRRTTGGAGFFHKMMYGVPGYFIFKNRMDGLLSGIDKFVLKPLAGEKKDGFMNKVLYGVGGSYRKQQEQIENLLNSTAGTQTFASFFEQMEGGNTKLTAVGKGKAAIVNKIKNNRIIKFIKKEQGRRNKMKRFESYLKNKGVSFLKRTDKVMKKAGMFFAVSLLLFGKLAFVIFAGLVALFLLVRLLKGLGLNGKSLEKWAKGMLTVVTGGLKLVASGIGAIVEGGIAMYEAIFQGGSLTDVFDAFLTMGYGLLEVFGGLLLILFSPLLGAIQAIIGDYGESIEEKVVAMINVLGLGMIIVGAILTGIVLFALATGTIATFVAALPFLITGLFVTLTGAFLAAINPFANGGVTKSGLSLVGERGPELVRLPKGSRVHSNQESKSMVSSGGGNNITVNVQGRLGASDSELRLIAQKVGQMINKEINRSTSSRTTGI